MATDLRRTEAHAQLETHSHQISQDMLRCYLSRFGSGSTSYLNLEEGVKYFHLPDVGVITFHEASSRLQKVRFVFAQPVCADDQLEYLLDHFLTWSADFNVVFLSVGASLADALARRGLHVNDIGSDFHIPLNTFKVKGRKMKSLRHARNLSRQGLRVEERSWAEVDHEAALEISRAWRKTKQVRGGELRAMTRSARFEDEWGVRKFYCYQGDELLGFIFFDPQFLKGRAVGYTANIVRAHPERAPNGTLDFIILEAIDVFRAEGVKSISLGLAPLYNLRADPRERRTVRLMLELLWRRGGFIYSFQSLAFHKTRYRVPGSKNYVCATPSFRPLVGLIQLLSICGALSRSQALTRRKLARRDLAHRDLAHRELTYRELTYRE